MALRVSHAALRSAFGDIASGGRPAERAVPMRTYNSAMLGASCIAWRSAAHAARGCRCLSNTVARLLYASR